MPHKPVGPHPWWVRPDWNGRMLGGGWDGEAAGREAPQGADGTGRSVVPLHDVHDGDGGWDEHGGQDHQEDHEWDQHGCTFFSLIGLWCLLIRGLAGGLGTLWCVR